MQLISVLFGALLLTVSLYSSAAEHQHHAGFDDFEMKSEASNLKEDSKTQAEVRKINLNQGEITLKHGKIKNLGMPGMTMVFRVKDKALLKGIQTGDKVAFTADSIGDAIVLTSIE